jgi:hypothetical protein
MNKRELIDAIQQLNHTAPTDFLASFIEEDLRHYLRQLRELQREHRIHIRGNHTDTDLQPAALVA